MKHYWVVIFINKAKACSRKKHKPARELAIKNQPEALYSKQACLLKANPSS
jgi:hypothetical protein